MLSNSSNSLRLCGFVALINHITSESFNFNKCQSLFDFSPMICANDFIELMDFRCSTLLHLSGTV